nr:DUF1127 domain-containing protein [Aminobacter sp. AP02]
MSTLTIRSPASAFASSWFTRARHAFHAYRARRIHYRAVRHLSELDDFLLKDIGVSRCEIDSAAYGGSDRRRGHADDLA